MIIHKDKHLIVIHIAQMDIEINTLFSQEMKK